MTVALQSELNRKQKPELEPETHWCEWQRIELLCLCLLQANQGPPENLLDDLRAMQQQVNALRAGNWWRKRLTADIDALELDCLACICAPQLIPRIGWLYQDLQSNREPAPCEALIAALLALPDPQLPALRTALQRLERHGLIQRGPDLPFSSIQPDRLALARLMGWTEQDYAPPGSIAVRSTAGWDDLVLPDEALRMLREFMLWLEHRQRVVEDWGGQLTGGPVALFAGPSGTGKTLAASVLANDLGWPLFRVDLAALVSKYIGETEKNIGRLFDATHGRRVFLQFDEVDALMGKRGELREARDRYANMEVSYLLARIESHDGPCILTTNLRSQIDKAFCRRFQMVVEFPRPDQALRTRLWHCLLPPRAPRAADLDLDEIAAAVNLTGGQIRNAALHAAYLAAAGSGSIDARHIARAILRELAKEQAQVKPGQLGPLVPFLDDEDRADATGN